jgi:hypothetical protein
MVTRSLYHVGLALLRIPSPTSLALYLIMIYTIIKIIECIEIESIAYIHILFNCSRVVLPIIPLYYIPLFSNSKQL